MKQPALIFLVTLAAYVLTAGGHLYSPDEEVLFRVTRSLALGQGLAVEPLGNPGFATRPAVPARADGREYAQYGIGQPILAVPLYWIGAALAKSGSDSTWQRIYGRGALDGKHLGYTPLATELAPRWACSWFNIILSAAMAALLYLVCLELTLNRWAATGAALLYALGTLAWPHSRPFFTEACATFWILLAWYVLLRAERGRMLGWCFIAGAAAGYAALVRMDSVLAYPGLALLLVGPIVSAARRQGRPFWLAWASFCLPAAMVGVVLIGLNALHFGGIFQTGYADQPEGVFFSTPVSAGLFGFLFSVGKGIFFFSPVLILSFWGWKPLARLTRARHPAILWALALAIAVPLIIHSTWQNWAGGWCWGPRHIFIIHPFLILPVAAWLATAWSPGMRIFAAVALITGVAVQILGCSQDFIQFYQRFFRSPGDVTAFNVTYDPMDQAYWGNYYQLLFRRGPGDSFRPLPILLPPRPIQDSLYLPQWSVWAGYPQMLREGELDNIWLHLLGERNTPEASNP